MDQSRQENFFKPFKYKSLRIYASTEWLAENKKKYRQVFDRFDTSYVYAELSLYNKNFDIKTWDINVELKCFELKNSLAKQLCKLSIKRKISKYDNLVHIREGWGNKKEGDFWKKGTYYWEAWVDGEKVGTKYFYIEDAPTVFSDNEGRYVDVSSIKLYEGKYDHIEDEERKYLNVFSSEDTRYVYSEIELINRNLSEEWHCEVFAKFYNEARELKGEVTRLQSVKRGQKEIKITAGWGANAPGSWREGEYTLEIIFMEQQIAVVDLVIADEFEEGLPNVDLPYKGKSLNMSNPEEDNSTFEEVFERLEVLVGLSEVKTKVKEHAKYIEFLKLRKEKGFNEKEEINIHSVFTGNPGTGKTTVAKMMGSLYRKMGLLSKGHVHEVDRVDLVGEYIGQTAPKVKEAIKRAKGGVLFIDEAYSLARMNDDTKDFGREVIEILVKEMSTGANDMAVIVAGYPKEMKNFIASNPGLKSRFKHYYSFKDYLPQELSEIAKLACAEKEIKLNARAEALIDEMITEAYRSRDKNFGNARYVYDLIDKAKMNLGLRIMARKSPNKLSKENLSTILASDVSAIANNTGSATPKIPIDEKLLESSMLQLEELIGIDNVKQEIRELVSVVRYFKESGKDVLKQFYLHTVFVGNPGTGKTTVARILTQIFKALGILERGHMVETDRQGLIAGFVGQTAIKTAERVEEALGGVLFIDEAYALSNFNGMQGDFGNEAIQTLLKRMEDNRGEFFIFAAGYPENMERFLKANPGLNSRFDKTLRFEDYTASQLFDIARKMIKDQKYRINRKARQRLQEILTQMYVTRDKYFGNARSVRKLVVDIIKHQNLRIADLAADKRKGIVINMITEEDIIQTADETQKPLYQRRGIGY